MVNLHKALTLITFLFCIFHVAFAYGSLITSNYAKTKVGEMVTFEILFWSDSPEKINFYADNNNLTVNILPNPLYLNPYRKDGEILVGGKSRNITKVRVFIVPKAEGKFNVTIFARKEIPVKDITFIDERVFRFFVETEGIQEIKNITQETPSTISSNVSKESTSQQSFIFVLLIILIVVVSLLIYRYS
jgi:hypothetical protein